MPNVAERHKTTQRKALAKQRERIRRYTRQRRALARLRADIRKAQSRITRRRKLIDQSGPIRIRGNSVVGGNARQRLVVAAKAAADGHAEGRRKSFYSQTGKWTVNHAITGEPRGYRSDCSQFVTSIYKSAGLPDPNGNRYSWGNTATLSRNGRLTTKPQPGDLGFYGPFPHRHVEMYIGNGRFIGHGSPPVDSKTPGYPTVFKTYV